jgi:hypothetical protein
MNNDDLVRIVSKTPEFQRAAAEASTPEEFLETVDAEPIRKAILEALEAERAFLQRMMDDPLLRKCLEERVWAKLRLEHLTFERCSRALTDDEYQEIVQHKITLRMDLERLSGRLAS